MYFLCDINVVAFLFTSCVMNFLLLMLFPSVLGAVEYKLFVGSLNKQATEKDVEEVSFISLDDYFSSDVIFLLIVVLAPGDK